MDIASMWGDALAALGCDVEAQLPAMVLAWHATSRDLPTAQRAELASKQLREWSPALERTPTQIAELATVLRMDMLSEKVESTAAALVAPPALASAS